MNPDIAGTYIHESNGSNYLELKPDGNCVLFEGSTAVSGTYQIDGSLITISNAGSYTKGMIRDGVITDAEGDRWILAKAGAQAAAGLTKCPNCSADLLADAKFCSNCGTVVGATATRVPPPSASARPVAVPRPTTAPTQVTFDAMIDSTPWLAGLIARNLPWELFEAIGWVAVLMLVVISVMNAKP
ncbi:MAG TPA: zinc ribbon domain-containing protein [Terriglobia bacterium]